MQVKSVKQEYKQYLRFTWGGSGAFFLLAVLDSVSGNLGLLACGFILGAVSLFVHWNYSKIAMNSDLPKPTYYPPFPEESKVRPKLSIYTHSSTKKSWMQMRGEPSG